MSDNSLLLPALYNSIRITMTIQGKHNANQHTHTHIFVRFMSCLTWSIVLDVCWCLTLHKSLVVHSEQIVWMTEAGESSTRKLPVFLIFYALLNGIIVNESQFHSLIIIRNLLCWQQIISLSRLGNGTVLLFSNPLNGIASEICKNNSENGQCVNWAMSMWERTREKKRGNGKILCLFADTKRQCNT